VTSPHVVIVEDNTDSASALSIMFSVSGYRVSVAHTATAAIAACHAASVDRGAVADLMLLDLSLPDADGLTVLAAATASGVAPRVTVALTGHNDKQIAAKCRAAGCRDVLVKPVSLRHLIEQAKGWTK
jgi:CheY-like chemotaxis protein